MRREIRYIARSPAQAVVVGSITLYEQTWQEHIRVGHPDVDIAHVIAAVDDPCIIHQSKNRVDTLVFTNFNAQSPDGAPIWVPVRVDQTETNFVTSAYYKSSTPGAVLWKRGDE